VIELMSVSAAHLLRSRSSDHESQQRCGMENRTTPCDYSAAFSFQFQFKSTLHVIVSGLFKTHYLLAHEGKMHQ